MEGKEMFSWTVTIRKEAYDLSKSGAVCTMHGTGVDTSGLSLKLQIR